MSQNSTVSEFPINEVTALQLVRDIAANNSSRVKFSYHAAKVRMPERGITTAQVFQVLKSRSNWVAEGPYQGADGDFKCNIQGVAAGDTIQVVVKLNRSETDLNIVIITVFVVN